jgi:hypothetical protein
VTGSLRGSTSAGYSLPRMRISHEEPGRRLELVKSEDRFSLPGVAIILGLTALVATPWRGLWAILVHGAGRDTLDLVPSAIWAAGGLFILLSAFGGHRLEGLCADRNSGRLEWRRSHVLGLVRWTSGWALETLGGLTLALAAREGPPRKGAWPLRLTLRRRPGQGSRERTIDFRVADLDRADEVADFALRLGAAAGLRFYRVTTNVGGRFAIEVSAEGGPGFEPVPAVANRAGYEANAVSSAAAAAAATERLPAFDPAKFPGTARVSAWDPGREVRFERGWSLPILLSPLVLAVFLGPLAFFRLPSLQTAPLLPRIVALVMITLVGVGLAVVGGAGISEGRPRRVSLDWTTRLLHVDAPGHRRTIPFSDITTVELRNKMLETGRVSGRMIRRSFWSQVCLHLRAPADPTDELFAQTKPFREDSTTPRQMAEPLARELAAALGVELSETGPPLR